MLTKKQREAVATMKDILRQGKADGVDKEKLDGLRKAIRKQKKLWSKENKERA